MRVWVGLLVGGLAPSGSLAAQRIAEPAIADNSFFIEEAYNQEPGVVQHISTLMATGPGRRDLAFAFTQEWPFRGQRHQLSYTVPVIRLAGEDPGLGDAGLNYRVQLGDGGQRWALAPRLSLIVPTGSVRRGRGDGSVGVQANLPVSVRLTEAIVTHWNAGVTILPRAKGPLAGGDRPRRSLIHFNLGGSLIAPTALPIQLLFESVLLFEGQITTGGGVSRSTTWVASPGVRGALNLGTLQIVPGVAVPFERSGGQTSHDLFLYLSFEHPFSSPAASSGD